MGRMFGTDGVRGLANREISAELAVGLGQAAARVVAADSPRGRARPHAVVGRDTRLSGEMLDAAVTAGLSSAGVDVTHVGVLPTPGIAFLAASRPDVDLAVVLSASHNPMPDNGIKFFARGGFKLPDAVEDAVEKALGTPWERPVGEGVGRVSAHEDFAAEAYIDHLVGSTDRLDGLRLVVDCANGAASHVAPEALRRAGAEVVVINAVPDGTNINDNCGSTHPQGLQQAVVEHAADAGFAYDGDADRCLAVDHTGTLVDGDQIMGLLALSRHERGDLTGDTLVATVMSNLGLKQAMTAAGIRVIETAVGDRYVLEAMREGGYVLGGEQSGHVIDLAHATTGDGTLTSLLVSGCMARTGRTLADLAGVVRRLPQVLLNVQDVVLDLAGTPWALLAVAVLSFIDGFFPPLPSESIIIALAALGSGEADYGPASFALLVVCAAAGAFLGDHVAYAIGRRLPLDRVPFLRGEGGAKALTTASRALERRGTVLIVSARFVPIGRIAVNMTAGATRFPRRRFAVVDAAAVLLWAAYSTALGAGVGAVLSERPLLAVVVGVAGGVLLGVILDKIIAVVHRRWFPESPEPQRLELNVDEEGNWHRAEPAAGDTEPGEKR